MAAIDKLIHKINRKPIPKDIEYQEVERLAKHYGCIVEPGGKHPLKVIHQGTGRVIPIPIHGKTVEEVYIKQLKELFSEIEVGKE